MDTIQAAILLKRLEQVEDVISARTAIAEQYNRTLSSYVTIPQQTNSPETRDAWFVYPIQTTERDKLIKHLQKSVSKHSCVNILRFLISLSLLVTIPLPRKTLVVLQINCYVCRSMKT